MKKQYKSKVLNFRVDEELHARVKSVAIAKQQTVTQLIRTILRNHIDTYAEDALVDELRKISPEKRLNLIHKIEEEEKEMSVK